MQNLEGDAAPVLRVAGEVDRRHPPASQLTLELIRRTDFQLTGWIDQTPFQQRSLKARGTADMLVAACEDENTRLVASKLMLPVFRRYLTEHYQVFPNFTIDPDIHNLQVFQCRLDR